MRELWIYRGEVLAIVHRDLYDDFSKFVEVEYTHRHPRRSVIALERLLAEGELLMKVE